MSSFGTRNARHKVTLAQLANQQAALETAKVRLSYTRIRAAWETEGGVRFVGERFVNAGAMLSSNTPILSVIELQPITAVIHVTEKDYFRLRTEQPVAPDERRLPGAGVRRSAWPGSRPLLKETSREARVEVEVENADGALKPGMFVNARIEFVNKRRRDDRPHQRPREPRRPAGAVPGRSSRDKTAVFQPATVGIIEGDRAEIVEPAELKGYVITLGHHLLENGTAIILPAGRPRGRCAGGEEDRRRQAMKLSEFSIRRPIFTWMVTLVVIIIGLVLALAPARRPHARDRLPHPQRQRLLPEHGARGDRGDHHPADRGGPERRARGRGGLLLLFGRLELRPDHVRLGDQPRRRGRRRPGAPRPDRGPPARRGRPADPAQVRPGPAAHSAVRGPQQPRSRPGPAHHRRADRLPARARGRGRLRRCLRRPPARDPGQPRPAQAQGPGTAPQRHHQQDPPGERRHAGGGHRAGQLRDPSPHPRRLHRPGPAPGHGRRRPGRRAHPAQ